jgi:probable HAF family extracellular repeat protein
MHARFVLALSVATIVACRESPPLAPDRPSLAASDAGPYEIVDLGSLAPPDSTSCRGSEAVAINDRGQVLGWSKTGSSYWTCPVHAFLWEDGVMTDLGADLEARYRSFLNDRGQITGQNAPGQGVFWDGGMWQSIGTLGGSYSAPSGLGPTGQVVGTSTTATGEQHAFSWQDGVMQDLGTLGGNASAASGVNSTGQIVGNSATAAAETHAFLWEVGAMRDLGTLGGAYSAAIAISENGAVTGESTDSAGSTRAFLWRDGVMQDLGVVPGFAASSGRLVNSRGDVAGATSNPAMRAFKWSNGLMQDLGDFGYPSTRVTALNPRGQITGSSHYCSASFCAWAFAWEDGVMTKLDPLPGHYLSRGNDMNAQGDVVGRSEGSTERYNAVLWRRVSHVAATP